MNCKIKMVSALCLDACEASGPWPGCEKAVAGTNAEPSLENGTCTCVVGGEVEAPEPDDGQTTDPPKGHELVLQRFENHELCTTKLT